MYQFQTSAHARNARAVCFGKLVNDFLPGATKGGCSCTLHLIDAVIIKLSLVVYICNHLFVTRGHDRFALLVDIFD